VPVPEEHLLAIAVGILLQRVRPSILPGSRRLQQFVGLSLIGAATSIVVQSMAAASDVRLDQPDRLVMRGPYTVSRNPMYVGWALIHLGVGVASGACWIVATLPAASVLVHRGIRHEERMLRATFGDGYDCYRAAVPRYLPRLRRNTHSAAGPGMGTSPEASVRAGA